MIYTNYKMNKHTVRLIVTICRELIRYMYHHLKDERCKKKLDHIQGQLVDWNLGMYWLYELGNEKDNK